MRRLSIALVLVLAAPAHADDLATAEVLFQQGRKLADAGEYQEACAKFEESLNYDRATGTLWHLANCLEETGAIASAWARFRELDAEARKTDEPKKAKAARERAERLEPRLPKLAISVPDAHRVEGLVVKRDGKRIGPGAWGTALPVDPGVHQVEASAPGYRTWTREAAVEAEGELLEIEVPALELVPAEPVGPIGMSVDDAIGRGVTPAEPWYRDKVGWALAGSGVALALGGALSIGHAGSLEDDAKAPGLDLNERDQLLDDADTYRGVGVGFVVVGAGLALAGTVVLALVPEGGGGTMANVSVRDDGFTITFAGSF